MDLSQVLHAQLLEIYRTVKGEIKDRKRKRHLEFAPHLQSFRERYPDEFRPESSQSLTRRAIPQKRLGCEPQNRLQYLPHLLAEDWTHLYPGGDVRTIYYVYAHCDPRSKRIAMPDSLGGMVPVPFYIGKGTGGRSHDLKRNQGHGIKLRGLLEAGFEPGHIVRRFRVGLAEADALALEAKLIYFFGTIYEQGRQGSLLNLDVGLRPQFRGTLLKYEKLARTMRSGVDEGGA